MTVLCVDTCSHRASRSFCPKDCLNIWHPAVTVLMMVTISQCALGSKSTKLNFSNMCGFCVCVSDTEVTKSKVGFAHGKEGGGEEEHSDSSRIAPNLRGSQPGKDGAAVGCRAQGLQPPGLQGWVVSHLPVPWASEGLGPAVPPDLGSLLSWTLQTLCVACPTGGQHDTVAARQQVWAPRLP